MTQSGTQSSKVFQSNRFMHSIDWVLLLNKEFQLATYILREADPKPVCLSYSKHVCSSACPSVRPLVRPFVTKAFSQDYLKERNFCGRNFLRKKFFAEEIFCGRNFCGRNFCDSVPQKKFCFAEFFCD